MKYVDDYSAKIKIWAREAKPYFLPNPVIIPGFKHARFNSYEEMNRWKDGLIPILATLAKRNERTAPHP